MDDDLIELRFQLYDDRFEYWEQRIKAVEEAHEDSVDAKESRHSRLVNWLMLGLFVVEVAIGVFQLVWVAHHA
jgi:hypothetical protein